MTGGSIAKTVTGVTTPNAVASGLASAINADSNLSAAGVTASAAVPTTSVSVVNVSSTSNNATTYTFSRTGSSTIALSKNVGVSQASFNNVNELTAISAGGSTRFQGTTDRPVQPVTINSNPVSMLTTQSFLGNAALSAGANSVSVSATAGGGGTPTTNSYKLNAAGANSATLTYDSNGNVTSDGTNSFSWDAENRLLQISYPGSGNNSQFVYDSLGRNVKIEERTGGSLTATKQFVWCKSERAEERDATGALTRAFFVLGQRNGANNYFYVKDQVGSIRSMTDGSSGMQASYSYDMSGRVTKLEGSVESDFQFSGYYVHSRSGLNLTWFRAYSSSFGRWLSRDPVMDARRLNLYAYVNNNSIDCRDVLGLAPSQAISVPKGTGAAGSAAKSGLTVTMLFLSGEALLGQIKKWLETLDDAEQYNACLEELEKNLKKCECEKNQKKKDKCINKAAHAFIFCVEAFGGTDADTNSLLDWLYQKDADILADVDVYNKLMEGQRKLEEALRNAKDMFIQWQTRRK